jgi:hypothetical protein
MTPFHVALLIVLHVQDPQPRIECRQWQECRQLAVDAAARQDFETFHDLAWRAVQTGPKNNPDLMYLLARAQSLSGRPGDALVMLQRLARMGVPTDAVTNDDFRRVRALPAWTETEAQLTNRSPIDDRSVVRDDRNAPTAGLVPPTPGTARTETAGKPTVAAAAPPPSVKPRATETRAVEPGTTAAESLRFTTAPFTPSGLAYDSVSRRFIVGDRNARKLAVVDEFSHHVANLASAQSSGFGDIEALEIDPRQGNLWVVSNDAVPDRGGDANPKSGQTGQTTLHKLQLVSGRLLASYPLPERLGFGRFADVAATVNGAVIVLDGAGHRLLRLGPKAQALELAASLPESLATSVAPTAADAVYVANESGILLVDLASRTATALKTVKGVDIGGITRLRWYQESLVAVQRADGSTYRAIRISLSRNGRTATALKVLDASLETTGPTAATVSGGMLYYLASGSGDEMIVRTVTLQ